jgi:hypothetical protein
MTIITVNTITFIYKNICLYTALGYVTLPLSVIVWCGSQIPLTVSSITEIHLLQVYVIHLY